MNDGKETKKPFKHAFIVILFVFALCLVIVMGYGSNHGVKCPDKMVLVKRGGFRIGCSWNDAHCKDSEKPPRIVLIRKNYCIDKFEVTQGDFKKATHKNPSVFSGCGMNCPVENVTRREASKYCKMLGKRLPTEAEWEYAARAGTTTRYYWGQTLDSDYAWYGENSGGKTHPVGMKKPNSLGLYDMLGNVWEHVRDCYDPSGYSKFNAMNPLNVSNKHCTKYVIRGASWINKETTDAEVSVSIRNTAIPNGKCSRLGFRCVSDPE